MADQMAAKERSDSGVVCGQMGKQRGPDSGRNKGGGPGVR